MSTPDHGSRAAELAAQQVEQIVAAAQEAAEQIKADVERKYEERVAALEADFAKRQAELEAEVGKIRDDASAERVEAAEKAADEALADAKAISGGLQRLGQSLEEYAERILRDVQAGHRRLRGDLRIAGGGSPATPGERARRTSGDAPRSTRRGAGRGDNPFEDIDLPSWVGND